MTGVSTVDYIENKGVYALVMHLPKDKRLQIGKLGSFYFARGWYVYLGSAHGGGGVRGRTNRRNDAGKPKRWHVDYLRPLAQIHEIWFAALEPEYEHVFADVVSRMIGSSTPVPGFGSRDCSECATHLFHLDRRPFVAPFRTMVSALDAERSPICVEAVSNVGKQPHLDLELNDLEMNYVRGSMVLEAEHRRWADRSFGTVDWPSVNAPVARKTWKHDIDHLSNAMNIPAADLKQGVKFAIAVNTIVGNCGGSQALECLLRGSPMQTRASIMKLSRTSDTRQRYRVDGVIAGKFRSVGPQNSDSVFDTIAFGEVPSRLARARGTLERLTHLVADEADRAILNECQFLIGLCRQSAEAIQTNLSISVSETPSVPKELAKDLLWNRLMSREVTGGTVGRVRAAVRLTVKSVWDFPEMYKRGLRPSQREKERTDQETQRIVDLADRLVQTIEKPL
jgi:Uri superfamily endonuclease